MKDQVNKKSEMTDRRLEIIQAAGRILATTGVSGLTTKHLAQEMNFSEGAIYKHFSSKEEILVTLLTFLADSLENGFQSAITTEMKPDAKLRAACGFMLAFFGENSFYVTAVFSDGLLETSQEVNGCMLRLVKTVSGAFTPIIQAGQEDGTFNPGIPSTEMTHIVMGSMRMLMFKWRLSEFKGDLHAMGNSLIDSLLVLIKQS